MEQCIYPDFRAFLHLAAQSVHAEQRHTLRSECDWLWQSPKSPDSSILVRRLLLQMLQMITWRESCQWNYQLTGWLSFGATGMVLTSTFLPDLLSFPGFEDGVVCIHCILIWQEGNIECPQQLWRSEKKEKKEKTEFYHLREFTNVLKMIKGNKRSAMVRIIFYTSSTEKSVI